MHRILCVDDDPNVLRALERVLHDSYDVVTAPGPEAALAALAASVQPAAAAAATMPGTSTFSVVVSDMRMPGMSGVELLSAVSDRFPDPTRVLLTGQADLKDAIQAVNRGRIFRFLMKPCPPDELVAAIDASVEQYQLRRAERELLLGTLAGAVRLVGDVLALVSPAMFARNANVVRYVEHMAQKLALPDAWTYTVAATLAPIGFIALDDDLVARVADRRPLSPQDLRHVADVPEIGHRLLANIPRLETVAQIVRSQRGASPGVSPAVARGAQLIGVAVALDRAIAEGQSRTEALAGLSRAGGHPPDAIEALHDVVVGAASDGASRRVAVNDLRRGMFLESDIVSRTGAVIVRAGQELNPLLIERVQRFHTGTGVVEPVTVRLRSG